MDVSDDRWHLECVLSTFDACAGDKSCQHFLKAHHMRRLLPHGWPLCNCLTCNCLTSVHGEDVTCPRWHFGRMRVGTRSLFTWPCLCTAVPPGYSSFPDGSSLSLLYCGSLLSRPLGPVVGYMTTPTGRLQNRFSWVSRSFGNFKAEPTRNRQHGLGLSERPGDSRVV